MITNIVPRFVTGALLAISMLVATPPDSFAMGKTGNMGTNGKFLLVPFQAQGAGSGFLTPVTAGCPGGDTCYYLAGPFVGSPTGTGTFTATVNTISAPNVPNNGSGGSCTPASGQMTFKFGSTGQIVLGFVGTFCDVGATPTSPNVGPVVVDASFFVTGGTGGVFGTLNGDSGRGEGGSGTGRLTLSGDADGGDALLWLAGILEYSSF